MMMVSFFLLFFVPLCSSFPHIVDLTSQLMSFQKDKFSAIDASMYESQPDIENSLNFCISQLVPDADQYYLTRINNIDEYVLQSDTIYNFDVNLGSDELPAVRISCLVTSKENQKSIFSYSYTSESNSSNTNSSQSESGNTYQMLDIQTLINTFEYQWVLQSAVGQFINQVSDMQLINTTNFTMDMITGAFIQHVTGGLNFQFHVGLTDFAGVCFKVKLNVHYDEILNQTQIVSYFGGGWAGDFDTNSNVVFLQSSDEFFQVSTCFSANLTSLEKNAKFKSILESGTFQVISHISNVENIPSDELKVMTIERVYQEVMDPQNFKVSLVLSHLGQLLIDTNFLISFDQNRVSITALSYILIEHS